MGHRFLLTSDLHYSGQEGIFDPQGRRYDYGESADARLQAWLDLIMLEHERQPLDAVFVLGDAAHEKAENLEAFMKCYADRLPCRAYLLPGNHEALSPEVWKSLTDCERQYSVEFSDCRFLMADCFFDLSHPHRLQQTSLEFLRRGFGTDKKTTFLCAHFLRPDAECEAFLQEQSSLAAVFHGHTHASYPVMERMGGKPVIGTGNFSYYLPTGKEETDWAHTWGMSVTELAQREGGWYVRKLYPEARYPFSELTSPNRFAGLFASDCLVKRHGGEWQLLE